jgi:hypothetical protein
MKLGILERKMKKKRIRKKKVDSFYDMPMPLFIAWAKTGFAITEIYFPPTLVWLDENGKTHHSDEFPKSS